MIGIVEMGFGKIMVFVLFCVEKFSIYFKKVFKDYCSICLCVVIVVFICELVM